MKNLKKMQELYNSPSVNSWMAVYNAFKSVMSPLESAMSKQGCSTPRLQIMFALYFNGDKQQSELAKTMKVSRANISTFIKRLIEDVLIEPSNKTDKRPSYRLTPKGIEDFEIFFEDHISHVKTLVKPIDKMCIEVLNKMADEAEANSTLLSTP